jgi:hypothetical protein
MTAEEIRLEEDRNRQAYWRRWGPYLSDRQWGTVREDYSSDGNAWQYFPHDHARSRAYRWGEDGIGGISDNHQRLCFALALWNGKDSILKERLFGLSGPEGNHGEDVKEYYFYLDNTPSHAYMKYLYKYPQNPFPYTQLVAENQRRGYHDPEFELINTGIFDNDEYYDVFIEYAKGSDEDILIKISVTNHASATKNLHLLPTLWFRNTWSWQENPQKPILNSNAEWLHLYNDDIISMPDKWEFPWYAAWDLAFHVLPLAMIDPDFAKRQMDRLTREWYLHPNGQIPAYEWHFSDVNPPVHAWGTWRVYQIEQEFYGRADTEFLERVFQKLLLNFTWWVNRKDNNGNNVFQGGFLGLDNIGIFDRSSQLPTGGYLEQSDGTSWMGMYCLNMLEIALELAKTNPTYEDIASKFFEHFLYIADAMNHIGGTDVHLWDENDQFFYDVLHLPHNERLHLKVRSMVGLVPLFAVTILDPDILEAFPGFRKRFEWFIKNRPNLQKNIASLETTGCESSRLLAIVNPAKLKTFNYLPCFT